MRDKALTPNKTLSSSPAIVKTPSRPIGHRGVKRGLFYGNKTVKGRNVNENKPYAIDWQASSYAKDTFAYSSKKGQSHKVGILKDGHYLAYLTLPLHIFSKDQRGQVVASFYKNGSLEGVRHATSRSSYIRNIASSNKKGSLHIHALLPHLKAGDTLAVKLVRAGVKGDIRILSKASLYLEKVTEERVFIHADATELASGSDFNKKSASPLLWENPLNESAVFSLAESQGHITLKESGYYLIHFSLPYKVACAGSSRVSLRARIKLDNELSPLGEAEQGYVRCSKEHQSSSLHWSGWVKSRAMQKLSVTINKQTGTRYRAGIYKGARGSIYIEKLETSKVLSALSQKKSENFFNDKATIAFEEGSLVDDKTYHLSGDTITVLEKGSYTLIYNDFLSSIRSRANSAIMISLNSKLLPHAACYDHYIRAAQGANHASCALVYPLTGLKKGDKIKIHTSPSGQLGRVLGAARLLLRFQGEPQASRP